MRVKPFYLDGFKINHIHIKLQMDFFLSDSYLIEYKKGSPAPLMIRIRYSSEIPGAYHLTMQEYYLNEQKQIFHQNTKNL